MEQILLSIFGQASNAGGVGGQKIAGGLLKWAAIAIAAYFAYNFLKSRLNDAQIIGQTTELSGANKNLARRLKSAIKETNYTFSGRAEALGQLNSLSNADFTQVCNFYSNIYPFATLRKDLANEWFLPFTDEKAEYETTLQRLDFLNL